MHRPKGGLCHRAGMCGFSDPAHSYPGTWHLSPSGTFDAALNAEHRAVCTKVSSISDFQKCCVYPYVCIVILKHVTFAFITDQVLSSSSNTTSKSEKEKLPVRLNRPVWEGREFPVTIQTERVLGRARWG